MNKKAQLDFPLIPFVALVVALLIIAPIMLKIFISIKNPISASFGNLTNNGGDIAQTNFNKVIDTGINFWDEITIFVFVLAVLILIVSSFLIDAHPSFLIMYIIIAMFLMIFAPSIISSADEIYTSSMFVTETSYLSFLDTVRTYFGEILVGLYLITGLIIFGKIVLFRGGNRQ